MSASTDAAPRVDEGQYAAPRRDTKTHPTAGVLLAVTRIALGFVFLWAFLDKTLGLGFATPSEGAWLRGGSPTTGFLASQEGTFAGLFHTMAGQAWVDWAFMVGMLLVGAALILGVAMRLAALGAVLLMGALWLASMPLENNPLVDEHLVYALTAVALAAARAGDTLGLGRAWRSLDLTPGWLA
jgi:thiosulfate dehydrogenase [quinone] large subunit